MVEVHVLSGVHKFPTAEQAWEVVNKAFRPEIDDDLWVVAQEGDEWYGLDYFSNDARHNPSQIQIPGRVFIHD